MKKLIKYEIQKSKDNEKGNVKIDLNSENRCSLKEKKTILTNNHCTNTCCIKNNNNNVFERLSRPSSKTRLCSKAVSTVGVQTDYYHNKQISKISINITKKYFLTLIHFVKKTFIRFSFQIKS